jgi:protein-tyrosine phosphatase
VKELRRRFGDYPRLYRLLDFAVGDVGDVPDPYYTGSFDYVYELVEEGCRGLLAMIREKENV